MNVTVVPAEDPADVRERDLCGDPRYRKDDCRSRSSSWASPTKRRPAAYRSLQGRPLLAEDE